MKYIPWNKLKNQIQNYLYINELEDFITTVIQKERPVQIYLFGSLVTRHYHWDSDADLFVLFSGQCQFKMMKQKLLRYVSLKDNMIDVFPYGEKDFATLALNRNLFIYNALQKSILIYDQKNKKGV